MGLRDRWVVGAEGGTGTKEIDEWTLISAKGKRGCGNPSRHALICSVQNLGHKSSVHMQTREE